MFVRRVEEWRLSAALKLENVLGSCHKQSLPVVQWPLATSSGMA